MNSKNEKTMMGVAVVLVVAAVGYGIWKWSPANNVNHPDGTFWICQNPACKHEFTMSVKEYAAFQQAHYGERVICPKCQKQETMAASQCPSCKRYIPKQRGLTACPYCKAPKTDSAS